MLSRTAFAQALFASATLASPASTVPFSNYTVKIDSGLVQGHAYPNANISLAAFNTTSSGVTAFLGVPYAQDTAYQNRWKPPKPRTWDGVFVASAYGLPCPSTYETEWSEDCLSANIWTPATTSNATYPVLVWNYGSGETSNEARIDGAALARRGIVVVTFNRRDNVYGWLAHPELLAESPHNSTGNYGTLDWYFMLDWVQSNIAAFGGDKSRVTIAGQSFGSAQVYHALNSPLVSGKFVGAIPQSGLRDPYDTLDVAIAESYVEMDRAFEIAYNYTANHNVSTIAELRNLTAAQLLVGSEDRDYTINNITALSTMYPLQFKPALDYYAIPKRYIDSLLEGPVNAVPVITGNNKDESGAATSTNYTVAQYTEYCKEKYGNLSSQYFTLWPAGENSTTASQAWNAAARDTSLVTSYLFANKWLSNWNSSFYTYYWDHAPPSQSAGAYHGSEIMYFWDSLFATKDTYAFTDEDYAIAEKMTAYYVNFIKNQDPNVGDGYQGEGELEQWPANVKGKKTVQHLGDGWGQVEIGEERVKFVAEYFDQQTPF